MTQLSYVRDISQIRYGDKIKYTYDIKTPQKMALTGCCQLRIVLTG